MLYPLKLLSEFKNGFLLLSEESIFILIVLSIIIIYSTLIINIELFIICIMITLCLMYYYRNYTITKDYKYLPEDIVAPISGTIRRIIKHKTGSTEIIFDSNMIDSGIMYSPCKGNISKINYNKGLDPNNLIKLSKKCGIFNEFYYRIFKDYLMNSELIIDTDYNNIKGKVILQQYSTSIISKIKYFKNVSNNLYIDDSIEAYSPLGIINHNSHITKMILPKEITIILSENIHVQAGITKIGKIESN